MNQNARGRFVWHELMTNDPSSATQFYQKVIGWTAQPSEVPGVDYTVFTSGGTRMVGMFPITPALAETGAEAAWFAYVQVPDCDETLEQAVSLGGSIKWPARDIPHVGRFGMIQDPQGAALAVISSANDLGDEQDPVKLGVSWHELLTTDWQAGNTFYEALFGWKKQAEHDMGPHGIYYMFGLGGFTYGGMFSVPPGTPIQWTNYFMVDDVDAVAERAVAAGGTIAHGPTDVPGGDRVATLIDPQGAMFGVQSKAKA